ncbi:hypothetical protein [Streptomyces sp. NPDC051000]|uniref:hypothetical protein n=1 Tax=Streptomyces sp. NPDC051000 TaxID=3155520 RepID=UPI0033FDCA33
MGAVVVVQLARVLAQIGGLVLLHDRLQRLPMVLRTLVLSAIVVLTVVYVLMPRLQVARVRLLARVSRRRN